MIYMIYQEKGIKERRYLNGLGTTDSVDLFEFFPRRTMDDSDFVVLFPLDPFLFIRSRSILRNNVCSSKPHWQTRSSKLSLRSPSVFSILNDLLTLVLVEDQIRRCGISCRSTNPLSLSSKSIRSGEFPALKPKAPWSIRVPPSRRSCTNG